MRILWLACSCLALAGCASGGTSSAPALSDQRTAAQSSAILPALRATLAIAPATSSYRVVWNFLGTYDGPHGASPVGGVVSLNGLLYGTTQAGGDHGNGTVYRLTPAGKETLLYNFDASNGGGSSPSSDLRLVGSTLYGSTDFGGGSGCFGGGCGTVFSVTASGALKTLYRFKGGTDGDGPSNVIEVGGTFYGTTIYGGDVTTNCPYGCGTVFSLSPSGRETIVYRFKGGADGDGPGAGLVALNGQLYGTTSSGGTSGKGTAFSIGTTGIKRTIYNFGGGADGSDPGGLTAANGTLYGITNYGGVIPCHTGDGCGTVFALDPSGSHHVIYRFKGGTDGVVPYASPYYLNGSLYGVTYVGGAHNGGCVFKVTTAGAESVVHSFNSSGDGDYPASDLVLVNGSLYGTTNRGGTYGFGTVYALAP